MVESSYKKLKETSFLIVEDDVIVSRFIRDVVRTTGSSSIHLAYDVRSAEKLISEIVPDIALIDIHLGGEIDGVEFARIFKKIHPLSVFVFITAYDDENTLERALALGPVTYLLKPFDERDLRVVIQMALKKIAPNKNQIRKKSNLAGLDHSAIQRDLDRKLSEEMMYLDPDLNLSSLAESIGITSHQLSEFLNHVMGVKFNDLINRLRVEESKKMIHEMPDMTLLRIGFEVGFNSRSTFHYAFRKATGISPEEYRQSKS